MVFLVLFCFSNCRVAAVGLDRGEAEVGVVEGAVEIEVIVGSWGCPNAVRVLLVLGFFGGLNGDVAVLGKTGTGWDQLTDDDVLL